MNLLEGIIASPTLEMLFAIFVCATVQKGAELSETD
jgi:hypothetical protein